MSQEEVELVGHYTRQVSLVTRIFQVSSSAIQRTKKRARGWQQDASMSMLNVLEPRCPTGTLSSVIPVLILPPNSIQAPIRQITMRRTRSSSVLSFQAWIAFFFLCFGGLTTLVQARVWNSHQLAVGEWDITFRGGWLFDPSTIFPTTVKHNSNSRTTSSLVAKRRPWGSSLDCSLSICPDGTFVLKPKNAPQLKNNNRLPLSGQWKVLSSPYCITDRFYDQLSLASYPRVEESVENINSHHVVPLRSVELDLSCRMWGKYHSSGGGLFRRRRGRMTHGTLVCKEQQLLTKKQRKWFIAGRPIVASFSALRSSNDPVHEGWEDQAYFGY
jgi:hypothetical protein